MIDPSPAGRQVDNLMVFTAPVFCKLVQRANMLKEFRNGSGLPEVLWLTQDFQEFARLLVEEMHDLVKAQKFSAFITRNACFDVILKPYHDSYELVVRNLENLLNLRKEFSTKDLPETIEMLRAYDAIGRILE
jgi:hypothetical protein